MICKPVLTVIYKGFTEHVFAGVIVRSLKMKQVSLSQMVTVGLIDMIGFKTAVKCVH